MHSIVTSLSSSFSGDGWALLFKGRNMNKAQLKNGNFYKVRALTHHGVAFLSVQKTSQKLSRFVLFFKAILL